MNSLALRGTIDRNPNRGENRAETVNDLRLPPARTLVSFLNDS